MKLPFRSALPPLDSSARLPIALAVLLGAALAFQLLAGEELDLPQPGATGGAARAYPLAADLPPAAGDAAIVARAMFLPPLQSTAAGTPGTAASPGAGIAIVGSIRIGRADFAVVQGPGAGTRYVRPGGRIGPWRLAAVTRSEVLLRGGGENVMVPFDGRALPVPRAAVGETR